MLKTLRRTMFLVALLAASVAARADNTLDQIKASGKLTVGIRTDTKPFGFRNEKGEALGFEHDLVADLVTRLQAQLGKPINVEKMAVTARNRMQFLKQGSIDLLIATMNDTLERRKIIDIVDPGYYASGVTLLALKANHVTKWEDLKTKWVCTLEGAWYNNEFAKKYGFDAMTIVGRAGATQAALANRCIGFLDDDTHAIGVLQDPEMRKVLEMPLETQSYVPWGAAVRLGNPLFHSFVADTIADWHRTGLIIELEKKYGIPPSSWAQQMHDKYAAKQK
jgi:polar amino acid transport system substrate-binding protein